MVQVADGAALVEQVRYHRAVGEQRRLQLLLVLAVGADTRDTVAFAMRGKFAFALAAKYGRSSVSCAALM